MTSNAIHFAPRRELTGILIAAVVALPSISSFAQAIPDAPLITSTSATPLNMLIVGRDHTLFFEAYNDASDIDGDGTLDLRFKPTITYYGLFDSKLCYTHNNNSTNSGLFTVSSSTPAFGTFLPFRFFHFFLMFSCLNWRSERIEMGNTSLISSEGSIKGGRLCPMCKHPLLGAFRYCFPLLLENKVSKSSSRSVFQKQQKAKKDPKAGVELDTAKNLCAVPAP